MMNSSFQRPPTPGFGKAPRSRRILVWSVLAVFLAAASGGYIFFTNYLLQVDTATDPADDIDDIVDVSNPDIDQSDWLVIQRRQLLRTGLHKLDQQAELIWENIDQLQQEIEAYETQFEELQLSEEGQRLINDEWAVRYFVDKWGEALPHDKVAKHCQVRLNELMFTVKLALDKTKPPKKKAAYEISQETQREVDLIEFEVNEAKKQYSSHRNLLRALAAKMPAGEAVSPKTLKDAVEAMRNQMTLEGWRHPSASQPRGQNESRSGRSVEKDSVNTVREPAPSDPSSLLDDVRRSRSSVGREFTDTTLGRDAVRDRDEPPRLRPE